MPRFSIFTPTHDPKYLMDAFESIEAQTFADWEWIVLANGGAEIDDAIASHPQVRVYHDGIGPGIGGLKRDACGHCVGEYLVELDHDDLLTRNALQRINMAIAETGADFLYSDCANFREDMSCEAYRADHGWQYYQTAINGHSYLSNRSFDITPSSLAQIFYAPNHVRVWSRKIYEAAGGGHDPLLEVADDHDLICRTYLQGAKFHYIPECLYLYRLHADGGNTYLKRNAEIQQKQQDVSNRYTYPLIAEWCKRNDLPMLDLGGRISKPAGFRSVDLFDADITCDVRLGLPFPDSSVGCIRAADFLEHIPHCQPGCTHSAPFCTVGLMNEIHRLLVPGGWLTTSTPSTGGRGAFQDPTHCSYWNANSFWYYTRAQQAQYLTHNNARFQRARCWEDYPNDWCRDNGILYVHADLVALKGQRQPGICEI